MGILTELLQHRKYFKETYRESFNENLSSWRQQKNTDGRNERIMLNWCHLYTCWQVLSSKLTMPVINQDFENYCLGKVMQWSSFIRSSDTLSEFWNTLAFLVDQGTLVEGWDFKINTVLTTLIRKGSDEITVKNFPEPTKVIYIRMNNVHKHYQSAYRIRTGKEGMTMENLLHYFSSRNYYVGNSKQVRFKRFVYKTENVPLQNGYTTTQHAETKKVAEEIITSSYVFLYNELGLDIERIPMEDGPPVSTPGTNTDEKPKQEPEAIELPF